jgi:hypothetical protein
MVRLDPDRRLAHVETMSRITTSSRTISSNGIPPVLRPSLPSASRTSDMMFNSAAT